MIIKILLLVFSIVSSFVTHAQINKGAILIGGSFGYITTNNNQANNTFSYSNTNISPRFSYAIGQNSLIGVKIGFAYSKTKSLNNNYSTNTSFGTNLFWRKYFSIKNKLGWYTELQGGIGKTISKTTFSSSTTKNKSTNYSIGAIPGLFFQAAPRLQVTADFGGVNYSHSSYKNSIGNTTDNSNTFGISLFSSFTVGVDFILTK